MDLIYEEETYAIRGAIYEVYIHLGLLINFSNSKGAEIKRFAH